MSDAKQALIPIMTSQYNQLYELEARWEIRLHEGDQRPRIDYFHDAVRALTSGEASMYEQHSRLSVEHLAYDLSQLRIAQSQPLGKRHKGNALSASTDLVEAGERGRGLNLPDRQTRAEISRLYKDYTVLYAALFAEVADMNFQTRNDEIDQAVEDIALIEQVLSQLANGAITKQQAEEMLQAVEHDELRERIQAAIARQTILHREAEQIIDGLKRHEDRLEADKQRIEQAHLNYSTAQLAVYEQSKDTVKRLAAQGMNIAGKFVESALGQQAGRGAGMGV